MPYIKKLVMHGFKSFPRKTELPFTEGINVILGPNGSGKSNVSDALCFVLGRLSIKSMRAAKAGNLIFYGTKEASQAKEASVELIFDNSDKGFTINDNEISIKRIVRRNGQSIYKINGDTKTRQGFLSLLSQAGIDPNGFNIVLQGEIQNFVRMHNDERRKVIEEVSGIAVYESRKEKSLKELEKTEERLKEIAAILRERTSYLANLEKERQQALKFKKLEADVKKLKASIIFSDLNKRKKESKEIQENIEKKTKEIDKVKKEIFLLEQLIKGFESKIEGINKTIQSSTGLEQESLNREIANIRAELAGMGVKLENFEIKESQFEKQKQDLKLIIDQNEKDISELKKGSPQARKEKEIEAKKKELEELEEQRKKFYGLKAELKSIRQRIEDRKSSLDSSSTEANFLVKQMESLYRELHDRESSDNKLHNLKTNLEEKKRILEELNKKEIQLEKVSYSNEKEIENEQKLIDKISKMDICPVCKSKITKDHIDHIYKDTLPKIEILKKDIGISDKEITELYTKRDVLKTDIENLSNIISKTQEDLLKLSSIEDKKSSLKNLQEKIDILKGQLEELQKIQKNLELKIDSQSNIEQKYETARIEVGEISSRTQENISSEVSFKQRELDRAKISLKQLSREEQDIREEISDLKELIENKEDILEKKRKQEEELNKKFQKLILDRDDFGKKIRESEININNKRHEIHVKEDDLNEFKVEKAKADAIVENLEIEMLAFDGVEIIKSNKEILTERLAKTEETLREIGSVNLRALEVYDSVKKEYDSVSEKAELISKEKEGILRIIHEIDIKKKKTFLKTLESLDEKFRNNFNQISNKGIVSLELENRKEPFEGGVGITVKTGHGKYLDVTSLSGGEQTMVAISLIFAIQELSPYCFYILDEVDAALDKRNSERLASLLNKYMKKGQYIVITHNDEIITNATNLYGVSMHEGISKIISLKI